MQNPVPVVGHEFWKGSQGFRFIPLDSLGVIFQLEKDFDDFGVYSRSLEEADCGVGRFALGCGRG